MEKVWVKNSYLSIYSLGVIIFIEIFCALPIKEEWETRVFHGGRSQ